MADDRYRSYFGHPILPCGYNSAPNDEDEIDGAGYNEPIWPVYFDTFEGLLVMMISQPDMDAFDTECPDYAPSMPENVVELPPDCEVLAIEDAQWIYVMAAESDTVCLPALPDTVIIPAGSSSYATPIANQNVTVEAEGDDAVVRAA